MKRHHHCGQYGNRFIHCPHPPHTHGPQVASQHRPSQLYITLKQIMESIGGEPFMVQCHRAFIVNLNFVVSLSNRNSAYQLQIFGTDKPIPVSRNNTAEVKEKLSAL